jgi:hypothetical protein
MVSTSKGRSEVIWKKWILLGTDKATCTFRLQVIWPENQFGPIRGKTKRLTGQSDQKNDLVEN